MDLIIRNARLSDRTGGPLDIGIAAGRIVAIEPNIAAEAPVYNAGGRLDTLSFRCLSEIKIKVWWPVIKAANVKAE